MNLRLVVTGTDTEIGKTVFAAALTGALKADYWKPVQAGLEEETDSERVARLTGCTVHPERYRLRTPASPHLAARLDGIEIDPQALVPPETARPLVIEGAGGVLVPMVGDTLYADVFAQWGFPVVLCARTSLGTISHSLMSIEALRARSVPVLGVAFIGEANEDSEATIARIGRVRRLGRLPMLPQLDGTTLAEAFASGFDIADFTRSPS